MDVVLFQIAADSGTLGKVAKITQAAVQIIPASLVTHGR